MPTDSPSVESFVLRFVQDAPRDGANSALSHDLASNGSLPDASEKNRRVRATWHAVVVHVQTNEEKTFTDFADAVAFIARYVPLGEFSFTATVERKPPTADSSTSLRSAQNDNRSSPVSGQ